MGQEEPLPPYTYIPGGPWPHPIGDPRGHSFAARHSKTPAIAGEDWPSSVAYLRGVRLFDLGYYWESHEVWEGLWHAHGRTGEVAQVLKALIKLAAAGVKVRQGQVHGVVTHARRAEVLFETVGAHRTASMLGLNLRSMAGLAQRVVEHPPEIAEDHSGLPIRVFDFILALELDALDVETHKDEG